MGSEGYSEAFKGQKLERSFFMLNHEESLDFALVTKSSLSLTKSLDFEILRFFACIFHIQNFLEISIKI